MSHMGFKMLLLYAERPHLLIVLLCSDILRLDGLCADAVYVRGLCFYYQDNMEKAFQHFQQVLRLAPDHSKARDVYRVSRRTSLMMSVVVGRSLCGEGFPCWCGDSVTSCYMTPFQPLTARTDDLYPILYVSVFKLPREQGNRPRLENNNTIFMALYAEL